jgi:uncharacterized protein (TIGR00288 family)
MDRKFAVFVDGDNIRAEDYTPAIKEISSTYGDVLVKRVYGDWTTPNMKAWQETLVNEPATPFQQFRAGKNATDTRIIMDAIEVMHSKPNINAFCIVSTDTDFYGLAMRLREHGKYVLGMGKEHSNPIWQDACDKFIKLESLNAAGETGVIVGTPKAYGLIKGERGIYCFLPAGVIGSIEDMKAGSKVRFKVKNEPNPSSPNANERRGDAIDVQLVP